MNVLDGLNDKQIEAVTIGDGPALVLAGAGTGKTLALVHRAAYLIANGVPPASIMAVTFTNKAAREMHERIRNLLGHEAKGIWCGTFHSICGRLMRQYHRYLPDGYTERFTILSDEDSMRAIKQTMSMASLSLDDLVKAISNYKTRLISAQTACMDADDEEAPISDSYDRYQTFLRLNNAMDFDDMIMLTAQMLQNNEHLRTALQNKFRYILVDEYQDVNYAQYHLIRLLGGARNNVFAVGDDFQAIYGFRGSNISLILRFTQDYPDAQIIRLEQNYRSTKTIIDASNNVIVNNKYQMPKELWTSNITGDPVYVHNAFSDDREAMWVIDAIRTLISSYGYNAGDCAVLYRTNHQSRALEDVLLRYRMNYVLVGGISFYERMEIRDLLAYMKFVLNPQNSISLRRIVNIPRRGIGDVTLSKIDEYAIANGMTLGEAMRYVNDIPGLRKSAMAGAHEFVDLISGISPDTDPHTLLRTIIDRTGYMGYLDGQDDDGERKLNVYELLSVCESYREEHSDKSAYDFIEEISLMTDADRLKEGVDAVKLMTVHAAKGLEFPVVFVTGAEERLFPYARRRDNDVDIEEERRLFYVAMTRAKELLYITYADTRNVFGRRNEDCTVSRFAEEIPQELIALI